MSFYVKDIGCLFAYQSGGKLHIVKMPENAKETLRHVSKSEYAIIIKTLENFAKNKSTVVYLEIKNNPITIKQETEIRKNLIVPGDYGRLPSGAGNLAWSIYKMLLREKVLKRYRLMQKNRKSIIRDYENGKSIKALTKKYDFPPTAILRLILESVYHFKQKYIKEIIQNPQDHIKKNKELIDECEWAIDNDVIASADQSIVQERAQEYEDSIGKYLKSHGIKYRTQESLVAEQEKKYGHAVATPDFLLESKVYLNNYPIAWIDAKHLYGGNLGFVRSSLQKQADKYTKRWGYGAFFFSAGYSEDLRINGAMLIMMEKPPHEQ